MSIIPTFLSSISSPIQNLPRELLEEIFLYHTPPDGRQSPYLPNDCWTLSSVCRSWRYAATHFSRLWRYITVPVRILAARCSNPAAFLSFIVSRANAPDLFITFYARPVYDDTGNNLSGLALALLNVLMERATQWRTLRLFKLDMPCTSALDGVHDMLSRLIELDIYTVVGDYYDSSLVDMLCQGRVVKRMAMYFFRPPIPSESRVTSQNSASEGSLPI